MEFVRRCRECPRFWDEPKIYCPECGAMSVQVPITELRDENFQRKRREAYARAKSLTECEELTRKFGDKLGYAYFYWNGRQKKRRP